MNNCECKDWCDAGKGDMQARILTGHHANCPRGGSLLDGALGLIGDLACAMEAWAADEDGIHPQAWESYRKAKALSGVYLARNDSMPAYQVDVGEVINEFAEMHGYQGLRVPLGHCRCRVDDTDGLMPCLECNEGQVPVDCIFWKEAK